VTEKKVNHWRQTRQSPWATADASMREFAEVWRAEQLVLTTGREEEGRFGTFPCHRPTGRWTSGIGFTTLHILPNLRMGPM